jgi:hypothetical protein
MNDDNDDYDTDDILDNFNKKKKKKNSGDKGKAGERSLIKELEKRFPGVPFSRTVGSGNRWSQARLTETAKKVFTSDIVTPDNFLFALECKKGYNEINLDQTVKRVSEGKKGHKKLDGFLNQAERDGEKVHKKPMMCWKRDYKPWLAFLKHEHLTPNLESHPERIIYGGWSILPLIKVLENPDDFFFKA